jgi:NDP-sugar pyrophosphorylase family protein
MTAPELIVMAAGIGSRYGGLKQIDPIGPRGESILDYSLYDAVRAGFRKFTLVVSGVMENALRQRVEASIGQTCDTALRIQELSDLPEIYAVPPERQKPWGTGHAVLTCRNIVSSPFGVINADDYYGRSSFELLYDFLTGDAVLDDPDSYCMIGYSLGNTLSEHGYVSRGICTQDADGYLLGVDERTHIEQSSGVIRWTENGKDWTEISAETRVSMNIWGFTPSIFKELERLFADFLGAQNAELLEAEFMLPEAINSLLDEKVASVKVLPMDGRWFGMTYQADKERAGQAISRLIQEGVYPEDLWKQR